MHIAQILVFYRHLIQFLGSEMEGPGQLLRDKYWSQTYNYSITSLSYSFDACESNAGSYQMTNNVPQTKDLRKDNLM